MQNGMLQIGLKCDICQRNKVNSIPYTELLQPLPILEQSWADISMDFIEAPPKSKSKDTILVVVDRLTKYNHFIPLAHPFMTISTAKIFFNKVIKYHRPPKSVISDRDKVFISNFCKWLFKMMGTQYHQKWWQQRFNQCLEIILGPWQQLGHKNGSSGLIKQNHGIIPASILQSKQQLSMPYMDLIPLGPFFQQEHNNNPNLDK